jgi:hypothetical protein
MFVSAGATILHADLDAFYASVEQRDDPRLRGRPVIVGAGVVLAASYEAKAFGIRTAMGGRQARRLCPRAVVVPPRMSAYSEASKAVFRVFDDTSPLVEGLSIDEAFLDVRGLERIAGTPAEIAARLRDEVRERVGLPITVGVARTNVDARTERRRQNMGYAKSAPITRDLCADARRNGRAQNISDVARSDNSEVLQSVRDTDAARCGQVPVPGEGRDSRGVHPAGAVVTDRTPPRLLIPPPLPGDYAP